MKTKNVLLASVLLIGATTFFTSCSKEKTPDPIDVPVENTPDASFPTLTVSGNITTNTIWTKDRIIVLDGRVIVEPGKELTIQAGTVIKAKPGSDASASALIIGVGAKIHATGTVAEPIIFTSTDDQILPGQITSPNLTIANKGLWGGVIILGDAPISPSSGTTAEIEGIPAGTVGTTYGGSDATDNSGELQYVSIRHSGVIIGSNNEINGLTLGGVGSGTTIDHIEIYANLDDGIEFFGGTVNLSHAIVVKIDDDCYDIDQAYSGTITNVMAIIGENQDGDAFEIDGPEGSANNAGVFTVNKAYVVGHPSNDAKFAVFKSNAQGTLQNVYFTNFMAGAKVSVNGSEAYANYSGAGAYPLIITGNTFNLSSLTGVFGSDQPGADATNFLNNNTVNTGLTNGFDPSQFVGWTLAGRTGLARMAN